MSKKYDLIVIGSGPSGTHVASGCAKQGKKVAIADYLFGGTCALRGCTPKKAMESVTSKWWTAQHLQGHGFPKIEHPIDWKQLIAHSQEFTALVPSGTKRKLKKKGIDLIEERLHFKDKQTLTNGQQEWTADQIVIATGAKPVSLPISGAEHLLTSDDFFELPRLPKHIVFIGGGYIAFELAHIVAACGSQVTIINDTDKPLTAFDSNLVSEFIRATLDKSIDVRLGYSVETIEKEGDSFQVKMQRKGRDQMYSVVADAVFNTAGRVAAVQNLQLDNANVATDEQGNLELNNYLQSTTNKKVYAVGDVTGNHPFTPVGHWEAEIVVNNLTQKRRKKITYPTIPFVLFGYPKLAGVGKTEEVLKAEGIDYRVISKSLEDDLLEKAVHNHFAGFSVFVQTKTDKILGAFVLGTKADDAINLFAAAIQFGKKASDLQNLLLAYPTATYVTKHMV